MTYVIIHCNDTKVLSLINMKALEEKLPAGDFIRVRKSFIVSVSKISSLEGNSIILKNRPKNRAIIAGKIYKEKLMERLKQRLIGG